MRGGGKICAINRQYIIRGEGRDWLGWGERHPSNWGAAVNRHSLERLNAINDYSKKKKYGRGRIFRVIPYPHLRILNIPHGGPPPTFGRYHRLYSGMHEDSLAIVPSHPPVHLEWGYSRERRPSTSAAARVVVVDGVVVSSKCRPCCKSGFHGPPSCCLAPTVHKNTGTKGTLTVDF